MNHSLLGGARTVALVFTCATIVTPLGAPAAGEPGPLTGDWSGVSVCADRDVCRDEKALYHLTGPDERRRVIIVGSKIVDGREIVMGPPLEFAYDPEKKTLFLENRNGVFRFTVAGDALEGTLTSPAGALIRRISLKKNVKPAPTP
jgi:hypothetical protein